MCDSTVAGPFFPLSCFFLSILSTDKIKHAHKGATKCRRHVQPEGDCRFSGTNSGGARSENGAGVAMALLLFPRPDRLAYRHLIMALRYSACGSRHIQVSITQVKARGPHKAGGRSTHRFPAFAFYRAPVVQSY